MFVTSVTQVNRALFETLAPAEWFEPLELPGRFVLGAIGEDEQGKYAAGVLVFEILEGAVGEDTSAAVLLQWLYVAPEFRGRGAGNALVEELFRILMRAEVLEPVLCDLPMGEEYNELCAFLEDWGFRFSLINRYEITVPLGELLDHPLYDKAPGRKVVPLTVGPSAMLQRGVRRFQELPFVRSDLAEQLPFCDLEVSCALWEDVALKGLVLVRPFPDGRLELLTARTTLSDPRGIMDLIRFSGRKAREKYPPETPVRVVCYVEAAADLIDYFIPGAQPLLVRRGISGLVDLEELMEEEV